MHIIKMYFTFFINIFFLYIYIIIQIGPRTQKTQKPQRAQSARIPYNKKMRTRTYVRVRARSKCLTASPNALRASNQNPNTKPQYKQTQFQNTKQIAAGNSRYKNVIYNFPTLIHTGVKYTYQILKLYKLITKNIVTNIFYYFSNSPLIINILAQ